MAGVNFKWYDGFLLSMLLISTIEVVINWNRYHCTYPLHVWTVVDYTAIFVFRVLMFVDAAIAAGMGVDLGWQQTQTRFCGRVVILSILGLLLYPFLWVWTIIGCIWLSKKGDCLPTNDLEWGIVIWLLLSYCLLLCLAFTSTRKLLARRKAHLVRAPQQIPVSVYGVLVDLIRVPEWAFEAAEREMRGIEQGNGVDHPGLYMAPAQREAVESLIEQLPKYLLKTVPGDCNDCPICLEEFQVGNEVRGLPCTHNFHVVCIDKWLRLNANCPRCRSLVFPDLDTNALSLV